MAIYLNDYRKAQALKLPARRCDEELLYVNGAPPSGVVALSCFKAPQEPSPKLSNDFEELGVRAFMERVRALASQI
jgi:hypothetical protein